MLSPQCVSLTRVALCLLHVCQLGRRGGRAVAANAGRGEPGVCAVERAGGGPGAGRRQVARAVCGLLPGGQGASARAELRGKGGVESRSLSPTSMSPTSASQRAFFVRFHPFSRFCNTLLRLCSCL